MALEIAQLGNPVLRKKADEVPADEITGDAFQRFLSELQDTLIRNSGAGLAGPQVFTSQRVFLARTIPPVREEELPGVEVYINPTITSKSEETDLRWEGCLSFPELVVLVERHTQITVEYHNAEGIRQMRELEGFAARVVQHENDHLDGILTIDRAPSTYYIIKESELDAFMEQQQQDE